MNQPRIAGIFPIAIGLIFLFAVWSGNSPFAFAPTFFKLLFTVVVFSFIFGGVGILSGALSPKNRLKSMIRDMQEIQEELGIESESQTRPPVAGYQCDGCGAKLDDNADVSPHGDVKCEHCGRWFNIHKATGS